jgi:hypothetical protein
MDINIKMTFNWTPSNSFLNMNVDRQNIMATPPPQVTVHQDLKAPDGGLGLALPNLTVTVQPKQKIERKFDGVEMGNKWPQYFYNHWVQNPNLLQSENLIKPHSKMRYRNYTYEGAGIINILKTIKTQLGNTINITWSNVEVLDSGSRNILIQVVGQINSIYKLSQSFVITFNGNNDWTMTYSLLSIQN